MKKRKEGGDPYEQWNEDADYMRHQELPSPEAEAELDFDDYEERYE